MADEKKPKIDLKARLGKSAVGGATPPPPGVGGAAIPAPAPSPGGNSDGAVAPPAAAGAAVPAPTPAIAKGGLPVPPGIPVGPPPGFKSAALNLDPSNPLAAAVAQPAPPKAKEPPKPTKIEVDNLTVQEARKGARKQGLIAGCVISLVVGAVAWIAGGASVTNQGRGQSVAHAKSLAGDVGKSREQLKALAEKLENGRKSLGERKFPDTLAKDLSGVTIDFDGTKLAGVRFSGFSQETTSGLIEYITGVQSTNDRKNALMGLLSKLQKPMTDYLEAAKSNKPPPINFVVLINKDGARNPYGVLAPLQKPIELTAQMPAEFTATDPLSKSNVTAPKLASLDKPGAAYMIPKSIEAACPNETTGQIGQLVGQLSRLINDIRGEGQQPGGEAAITEPKPGLLERSDRLITGLNKVQ